MEQTEITDHAPETLSHWLNLAHHVPLGVICDLDGTLLPFTNAPWETELPVALARLLNDLAALPDVRLSIVSGRLRDQLDRILAPVPDAWLVAEHGAWRRYDGAWISALEAEDDITPLRESLEQLAAATQGSFVERKSLSVAFHYRLVPPMALDALMVELDVLLQEWLDHHPTYERLDGAEVVEIRPARIRKGLAVDWVRDQLGPGARLLALGDDVTDEDMFRELGVADDGVLVGRARRSRARWRLDNPAAATDLLRWLVDVRCGAAVEPPALPEPLQPWARRQPATRGKRELLVVSNRLPAAPRTDEDGRRRNVGGLIAALQPALESRHGLWLGWSGQTTNDTTAGDIEVDESSIPAMACLDFPDEWYRHYYNGFSNRALWPLFHSFPRYTSFVDQDWECYRHVNHAFATAAAELTSPETPIWLHDYHLLMVARGLREMGHYGPAGLFLHIPFPGPDLFGLLPWAEQLLDAMLDLDLIGFHTDHDVENFRHTVSTLSPARLEDEAIIHRGRRTRVAAFPIGIVPEPFQEPREPQVVEEVAALLRSIAPSRLILGVDRLDYTKGIPERLEAFGLLLERFPEWRGQVALVQISVPSREDVPEYVEQRRRIENVVGRINGQFGEATWVPVRYLYRSYSPEQLAELYSAAAVGYVTPLRDGMNLVAKEYVAAQDAANPGVLVLSKFAGAAAELTDAVLTNPWHPEGVARDLDRALRMELSERRERHKRLLTSVLRNTANSWAEDFLNALREAD